MMSPDQYRKSRTAHWQLTGSSFWTLIAAKDSSLSDHPARYDIGLEMTPKDRPPIAAIRVQKDGRPAWRRVGHAIARIVRKSRTFHCQLTGSSFWALISAKNASILAHISQSDKGLEMPPKNRLSLGAIRGQKDDPVKFQGLVRDFRPIMGKSWSIRHRSGRPSFWTLISDTNSLFFGAIPNQLPVWLK